MGVIRTFRNKNFVKRSMKSNKNVKGMELEGTRTFGDNDVEE